LPSGAKRDNYFHVSDWLPTLASLSNAGINFDRQLDGINLSRMITSGEGPYRQDIETIDQVHTVTSIIHGSFKLVNSTFLPLGKLNFTF
jgi:arylsulfatase A-like enzyme